MGELWLQCVTPAVEPSWIGKGFSFPPRNRIAKRNRAGKVCWARGENFADSLSSLLDKERPVEKTIVPKAEWKTLCCKREAAFARRSAESSLELPETAPEAFENPPAPSTQEPLFTGFSYSSFWSATSAKDKASKRLGIGTRTPLLLRTGSTCRLGGTDLGLRKRRR